MEKYFNFINFGFEMKFVVCRLGIFERNVIFFFKLNFLRLIVFFLLEIYKVNDENV